MKKILSLFFLLTSSVYAAPSGFNVVFSDGGVTLYTKYYSGGQPDYVQEIDLSSGAKIKLLTGKVANQNHGHGNYGGKNPSIYKEKLKDVWNNLKSKNSNVVCVTNGQFFATSANPTTLAFPVKIDGNTIDGYGIGEYAGEKYILNIESKKAEMVAFSDDVSVLSNNAIVGLSQYADKGYYRDTGRTFIGVADKNSDGYTETVYIFNSKLSSQKDAAKVLSNFGASNIMMLDGGGSSQLICNGKNHVTSTRILPQTIATIKSEKQQTSYIDQVNVVFNYFEKTYGRYFPVGATTNKSGTNYYRYYYINGKYHYLYAYNEKLYYHIGSGWKQWKSIETWYKEIS